MYYDGKRTSREVSLKPSLALDEQEATAMNMITVLVRCPTIRVDLR